MISRIEVLRAVRQTWRALQFAAPDLRKNPSVVRAALAQDVRAMDFADKERGKGSAVIFGVGVGLKGSPPCFVAYSNDSTMLKQPPPRAIP